MKTRCFLPSPERCESLANVAARWHGTLELHEAGGEVAYTLPIHATAELRAFWQAEAHVETPPVVTARIPEARVFGAGIVLSPDGKSIARDVSLDFGKPFTDHWLLTYGKIPPPLAVGGTTAVIATTLGGGYGHWLLDELPRLLSLPPDGAENLIAHGTHGYARTALNHRGWTGAVLPAERQAHFRCEQLLVPSLVGTVVQPTRRGLDLVADFTAGFHVERSAYGERIFITREHARRRRIVNEPELWAELQGAGFVKVRLDELTWAEQINAFRHAKVVVAPHGAGLANLAFSSPGTRVLELFNRSYVHGCFWRLAALQQLDYWPIVPVSAEPLGQASACNRLDLQADLAQVRAALHAL